MIQTQTNPIRVLHVVTNMSYGGLENLLMNYYRNIDRTRIQFDFLTHFQGHQDFEEEIKALGGCLFRLPRLNPLDPRYLNKLNRFFADHPEYKIVHSHLDCMAGIPLKYAKKNLVPVRIAHAHNSNQLHNLKYIIKRMCKPLILRYATNLFACGVKAGNWMFDGKPFSLINNAIDARSFMFNGAVAEQLRENLQLQNDFVVGHVGQLRQEKNHLFLIDVFNEILKIDSSCTLVLVGKGPQMEPALAKVNAYGIAEHVKFLGARSDIPSIMQAMDVFVLPSFYEGFPVTMIEAQAAGLPCVISDGVPLECKITDQVKQISLTESPQVWAEEILKYKNLIRRNNYDVVVAAGYDINANVLYLEEFYQNAINRS